MIQINPATAGAGVVVSSITTFVCGFCSEGQVGCCVVTCLSFVTNM